MAVGLELPEHLFQESAAMFEGNFKIPFGIVLQIMNRIMNGQDKIGVKMLDKGNNPVGNEFHVLGSYITGDGTGTTTTILPTIGVELTVVRSIDGNWYALPPWLEYGDGLTVANNIPKVLTDGTNDSHAGGGSGLKVSSGGVRLTQPGPIDVDITYFADIGGTPCNDLISRKKLEIVWTLNSDGRAVTFTDTAVDAYVMRTNTVDGHCHCVLFVGPV